MTNWIIGFTGCSGLLLLVYRLVLQNRRMAGFSRVFLLASLILSVVIPFLNLPAERPTLSSVMPSAVTVNQAVPIDARPGTSGLVDPVTASSLPANVICIIYWTITAIMGFRFIRNLAAMLRNRGEVIRVNGTRLVLLMGSNPPYSFWKTIFVSRDEWLAGEVDPLVIRHESVHVRQLHTFDILIVELIKITCWFNPFLYLYRSAISLNHEFLADEGATLHSDTMEYQYLLLKQSGASLQPFSSPFHFSNIKKRLLMLSRTKRLRDRFIAGSTTIPVLAFAVMFFSSEVSEALLGPVTTVQALPGRNDSLPRPIPELSLLPAGKGASGREIAIYQSMVNKASIVHPHGAAVSAKYDIRSLTGGEIEEMGNIYRKMTTSQRNQFEWQFIRSATIVAKNTPSSAQYDAIKDTTVYRVWLDNKEMDRAGLDQYRNTDIATIWIGALDSTHRIGKSYTHRVHLLTHAGYDTYVQNALASPGLTVRFVER